MKPACTNLQYLPDATDSDQKREVKNAELVCSNIVDLHEGLHINSEARLNLKNHSVTQQHACTKKKEARSIPTIINGQIINKETSRNKKQTPSHQQKLKQKTTKTSVSPTGRVNKILIIGYSHVRGISEMIRAYPNVPFNVTGITKPNANTESITFPSHFRAENLTKKDRLIFYGGTKDMSHNETIKGLRSLKAFAHRTINTNVILLEAPHRHDLPPSSCVNKEVTLFNKRLHSLSTIFNHVKVLIMPTERRFHTNHGLHLN
jgi:hypothetical protein